MSEATAGYVIPGLTENFRGVDRVIPPLNLDQVQELTPDIILVSAAGKTGITPEVDASIRKIFVAAVKRNYPDYTAEDAGRDLDMGNMTRVIKAILGRSGTEVPVLAGKQ